MFPHCEAFFKNYRLTGRTMNSVLVTSLANIIKGGISSSVHIKDSTQKGELEEIVEVTEEAELKRDTISN